MTAFKAGPRVSKSFEKLCKKSTIGCKSSSSLDSSFSRPVVVNNSWYNFWAVTRQPVLPIATRIFSRRVIPFLATARRELKAADGPSSSSLIGLIAVAAWKWWNLTQSCSRALQNSSVFQSFPLPPIKIQCKIKFISTLLYTNNLFT